MIRKGVIVVMLLARVAFAQTSDPILATELFNQGRDLLVAGDLEGAYAKLSESARLDPKVGTLARLAECEEKLGRMAAARGHWQQSLNVARSENDDRAAHVEQEFARVDAIVPKLRITAAKEPEGLEIAIDGTKIRSGALGAALPVEAGSHVISAVAPKKKSWVAKIETALDGKITSVEIPVLAEEAIVASPTTTAAPITPQKVEQGSPTTLRVIGASIAGAGFVALGLGVGFAVDAKSKLDASNAPPNGCVMNVCPPDAEKTRLAARDSGTIATVFFVAGGVASAAGLALWFLAPAFTSKKVSLRPSPLGVDFESRF